MAGLLSGSVWFAAFLAAHVLIFHRRDVDRRFSVILRLLGAAIVGHVASTWLMVTAGGAPDPGGAGGPWLMLASGTLTILSGWILYMPFYYVVATSVSVRTLVTLRHAPGGTLPRSALESMFASTEILQGRLETMVTYGHVSRRDDRFALAGKGRVIARSFRFIKGVWRLGPGG
jgi:hypothetical protein